MPLLYSLLARDFPIVRIWEWENSHFGWEMRKLHLSWTRTKLSAGPNFSWYEWKKFMYKKHTNVQALIGSRSVPYRWKIQTNQTSHSEKQYTRIFIIIKFSTQSHTGKSMFWYQYTWWYTYNKWIVLYHKSTKRTYKKQTGLLMKWGDIMKLARAWCQENATLHQLAILNFILRSWSPDNPWRNIKYGNRRQDTTQASPWL